MLLLTAGCVLTVLVAVWIRVLAGWPDHAGIRSSAGLASIAAPVALLAWLPSGPLGAGWATRAGTPASLLAKTIASASLPASSSNSASGTNASASAPARRLSAQLSGTVTNSQLSSGLVRVDLKLNVSGQRLNRLEIRIVGQPLSGGGVAMASSRVTLGPASNPDRYAGRVTALEGTNIRARVSGRRGSLSLLAQLQIDPRSSAVAGALAARPGARTEGDG